jgi:excisionase family DNA binding protein
VTAPAPSVAALADLPERLKRLGQELLEVAEILRSGLPDLPPASNGRARPAPAGADDPGDSMDPDLDRTRLTLPAPDRREPRLAAEAVHDGLLTMNEVADLLRIHPRTLREWRHAGNGPPEVLVGSRPRCLREDVEAWLSKRRGR